MVVDRRDLIRDRARIDRGVARHREPSRVGKDLSSEHRRTSTPPKLAHQRTIATTNTRQMLIVQQQRRRRRHRQDVTDHEADPDLDPDPDPKNTGVDLEASQTKIYVKKRRRFFSF